MKRLVIGLLVMGFMSSSIYGQESLPEPWAQEAVEHVIASGLVDMDRVKDFGAPITRQAYGYMIYQLYEYLGSGPISSEIPLSYRDSFTDLGPISEGTSVSNDFVFLGADYLYLEALKAVGLIEGYPDGTYRPSDYITREEIMTLYVRLLESLGYGLDASELMFEDEGYISHWALESVKKCYGTGLIQGVGDDRISPKGYATVEETLVVMSRIINHPQFSPKEKSLLTSSKSIVSNGVNTYSVSYDVFGEVVGISHYEDYTYKGEIYDGELSDKHIYLIDNKLYFFDEHSQLVVYDGTFTRTSFMTAHKLDDWYVFAGVLYYYAEGLWLSYDLEVGRAESGKGPIWSDFNLDKGNLTYGGQVLASDVVSYDHLGQKVYWLTVDEHLFAYDGATGGRLDYGVVSGTYIEVSYNYLVLGERTINGKQVVRYIPIFALENYL